MGNRIAATDLGSGSRFFAIATEIRDLLAKQINALTIATGDRNGQCELELFELMAALTENTGLPAGQELTLRTRAP